MWKTHAVDYLQDSIRYEILSDIDSSVYREYMDELIAEDIRYLSKCEPKHPLFDLRDMLDCYLDAIDWVAVEELEGGLDIIMNGAAAWVNAISVFFMAD